MRHNIIAVMSAKSVVKMGIFPYNLGLPYVKESGSGTHEFVAFGIRNLGRWNPESRSRNPESCY